MPLLPDWAPAALTLLILGGAIASFVRERIPADMTALIALLALLLTGVLTPAEAFSGFAHPATISVAAVLVLSAGLQRTGVLTVLARRVLAPLGRSEFLLTLVLMILVGSISAFINNTAAVAVFIPVVLEVCRRSGASPGRVLMPMAHAATLGGLCTLIGTSTNLAAHEYARSRGLEGFGMFELGRAGLPMALAGCAYMLLVGRWFLPRQPAAGADPAPRASSYLAALVVPAGSRWIGRPIRPEQLRRDHDAELIDVLRDRVSIGAGLAGGEKYRAGDRLRVRGPLSELLALAHQEGLAIHRPASETTGAPGLPLSEVVVLPASGLVGRTLRSSRFGERFGTVVLALHRPGVPLSERPEDVLIHAGDVLVLEGTSDALARLVAAPGFLVAGTPSVPDVRPGKLGIVVLTVLAVVGVAALGWMPIVTAAAAGCVVLILTKCLEPRDAYRAIDLGIVFLLAGALALGTALEKTGVTDGLGALLAEVTGLTGPYALLVGFYVLSVVLSELMSNSGTVLLLGPVAITSAEQLGINPTALIAAVTFGSSTAFAMPIGYQTSLMIYGPGGYRFKDFLRMGIPLDVLLAGMALWLIPRLWPLTAP